MRNLSRRIPNWLSRLSGIALVVPLAIALSGCGSGAVSSDQGSTTTGTPTMVLALTELSATTARTSIAFGNPAKVSATIRSGTTPIVGVVVTFTTAATLGTFSPAAGTALTDASGVASVTLSAANFSASGAGTVNAAASVPTSTTPVALSQSIGYSVGAANVTISPVAVQTPALSAFGTTALSVTVSSNGQPSTVPLEVRFTSPCALSGKAALTASASTVNGIASATYRDIGCAAADTITATITGTTLSSSGVVTSAPPAVGSIQFISAQPTSIALRGTGGVGRQETSLVTFRVVDVGGNPIGGRVVNFALNTNAGGLTITPSSATSDAAGLAVTTVSAGSVSTPVRVTASTTSAGQTLSTQSDQLTVSTGVPSQGGFSLSVSTFNIEGWVLDGTRTQVIARLADRFSNPVPDGTVVNFTAAGGSIGSTCTTKDGACTTTLTSQNFRTANGRIAILAYAIGEESFNDRNGNGWFDLGEEIPDPNFPSDPTKTSVNLPEAWLDLNEDGERNDGTVAGKPQAEPFIDFNNDFRYNGGDGKFNGVSCDDTLGANRSSPNSCAIDSNGNQIRGIHVRDRSTVVFSGSTAKISSNSESGVSFTPCVRTPGSPQFQKESKQVVFTVVDINDNVMPAGTTVTFTSTNGTITSLPVSFTVPNSNARLISTGNLGGVIKFPVSIESDATQSGAGTMDSPYVCSNTRDSGDLRVTVKVPSGLETIYTISVKD
jgi:hypothetical protein